jgi:hypothetical protein
MPTVAASAALALRSWRSPSCWPEWAASRCSGSSTDVSGRALLGLLLWSIGFGSGSIGLAALVSGACAWMIAFGMSHGRASILAVLCGLLACAQPLDRVVSFLVHRGPAQALAVLWLRPPQYMTDWSEGYPVVQRKTDSGLTIYVTRSTSFQTPVPNTRFFRPCLELRRAGSLASGFRMNLPPGVDSCGELPEPAAARPEH